jgi:hypothetical protein
MPASEIFYSMINATTKSAFFEQNPLTSSDYAALSRCGIPAELVDAAGLFRVDSMTGAEIVGHKPGRGRDYAGVAFPYFHPLTGATRDYRLRRDNPDIEIANGKQKESGKYLSAPGSGNKLYFPPGTTSADLSRSTTPLLITEGEKMPGAAGVPPRRWVLITCRSGSQGYGIGAAKPAR